MRYAVVQQTHAGAIVFGRKGTDWVTEIVSGDGATVNLVEIGISLPLAELQVGVSLDPVRAVR